MTVAAACRLRARLGYPSPCHRRKTSPSGADAQAGNVDVVFDADARFSDAGATPAQRKQQLDTLAAHLDEGQPADEVVVLHQAGSHGPAYSHRYPAAFRRYAPDCTTSALQNCSRQEIINAYDNTIAYTDHFLGQTLDWLQRQAQQGQHDTGLIYLSDHGESLGENGLYLHGLPYALAPVQQTHVPMVAWLSPGLQQRSGVSVDCLRQRSGQALSHDNVFHSVLGLMDVKTAVHDPALDLYAPCAGR